MSLPTISPHDAKRLIVQGATLVDIRGADERAREHVPGSLHGPLERLPDFTDVSAPIIFHCKSGMRTSGNSSRLRKAVRCEAYMLAGGIESWKQAGLPVVTDETQPIEINRQVMIAAGSFVLLFLMLGALIAPAFYGLAALIGAGLIVGGVSGWCGMAKLLEAMPWNRRVLGA